MEQKMMFATITKVDEAKRLVFGRATQEVVDAANEKFDYATSKPLFAKWSEDVKKDSGGKSLGNVRAMHGNVAAGKLDQILFVDDEQAIDVSAKIVDDAEWNKVLEGVYTGFSIGGRYVKKWKDKDDNAVTRYTAKPSEISLVDRPACPTATFFEIQKADGSVLKKDFKTAEDDKLTKRKEAVDYLTTIGKMKAEDLKDLPDEALIESMEGVKAAVQKAKDDAENDDGDNTVDVQVPGSAEDVQALGKTLTDGKLTIKEADAIVKAEIERRGIATTQAAAHANAVEKMVDILVKAAKIEKFDPESDIGKAVLSQAEAAVLLTEIEHDWPANKVDGKTVTYDAFRKGLEQCGSFSYLLASLNRLAESCMVEQEMEGDDSAICERMKKACHDLGEVLRDMVQEEIDEELAGGSREAGHHSPSFAYVEAAGDLLKRLEAAGVEKGAKMPVGFLKKVQRVHDLAMDCGVKCDMAEKDLSAEELKKSGVTMPEEQFKRVFDIHKACCELGAKCNKEMDEEHEKLLKGLGLEGLIAKAVLDATAPLQKQIKELSERAGPAVTTLRVVTKGGDIQNLNPDDKKEIAPVLKGTGDAVNESATAIKAVHAKGGASFIKLR